MKLSGSKPNIKQVDWHVNASYFTVNNASYFTVAHAQGCQTGWAR